MRMVVHFSMIIYKEDAINNNILNKANEIGIEKLASFFKSFGFKVVNITLNDSYDVVVKE
jgi:methylmalonyl-CoA mutase cobalamin-binding subunit